MSLLTCENLSLGYEGRVILENLSFSVNSGDYLCILGENGSGKSTLVKTILGLRQQAAGQVRFGDGLKQREIGYLPQQTDLMRDFPASVWEIVLSGCENRCGMRPFYNREEKERAENALEKLEIANLKKRSYRELSGGQQQRVLLARALCASERLLLLDEPVAGLDPDAAAQMYRVTWELNTRDKMTILMVSHDMVCLSYATHVLHFGAEVFFGTKSAYQREFLK
ncbi:MAG: ABC transporter ATP-binding protein [Lachnospiraceae bacterium]|nr:ABC transporter ATP-binding protein [Lachnospiraceae bacterium]